MPASAMARRTAVAMATAPGESPWMHSVSTQSVSTLPSLATTAPRARLQRLRGGLLGVVEHGARLVPRSTSPPSGR